MSTDQTEYELFISYARLDNQPIPETYPLGWVTALRDHIVADQRRFSTEPLRIFFDTHEIQDMDDWRHRILGGLCSSKVLLVCLSPNYFRSEPCKWEWDEYLKRQTHQLMGFESIAAVYFVEIPDSLKQEKAQWFDELMRVNYTDLRPWFPTGAAALHDAEVKRRLDALGLSLWERIERARRARSVPGNVRRTNPFFVGRRDELRRLHEQLGVGAIGVVTAVHGLGGMGKTELAYHYANGFADCYPVGLWSLAAEGKKELLPLLGDLAFVPQFGFTPTDVQKADPHRLGLAVLLELQKRSETASRSREPSGTESPARLAGPTNEPGSALIILDNVSEAELLSVSQLATLPHPANWLRIVATTRLGPERLAKSDKQLAAIAVDALREDDALDLIREHLPQQRFTSAAEESAAREIVRDLGGFTLAVEQVAVHLGLNADDEPPSAFLRRLRADGLPSVDELPRDADVAAQLLHQQKQLGPILRSTLEPLTREIPAARTALHFAALLPPDSVPWPWLRELTTRHHPGLADRPAEWGKLKRRLEGLRLLTSGDEPEMARVHRLVAAHLQKEVEPSLRSEVNAFAAHRAHSIQQSQAMPASWELDALLAAIPFLLNQNPDREVAIQGTFLTDKVIPYRSLATAAALLQYTHPVIHRLAESDSSNDIGQRDLSVSLSKLGDVAVAQGNFAEAQRFFSEALGLRRRLASSYPGNAGWQRALTVSLIKLGDVAVAKGNLVEARDLYSESLQIMRSQVSSDSKSAVGQHATSVSLSKLGDVAIAQGNFAEAQRFFSEALGLRRRLASLDSKKAGWQRDLAISLNKLGDVAMAQGNLVEARDLFSESLQITRQLASSDTRNMGWQRSLSVSLNKLGDLEMSQGNLPKAQPLFTEALCIRQRLVESDPGSAVWQRDLWESHLKIADLQENQGDATATQHWRQAHDVLAGMVQAGMHVSPQDREFLEQLREDRHGRVIVVEWERALVEDCRCRT